MRMSDTPTAGRIEDRAAFEQVRYANCWEDANILCEALRPAPGKRVLSIASAGDNALALLAEGAEVVAADLNAAQLACLELRCAAFRRLDHDGVLRFLGVRPDAHRADTYRALEADLSPSAREHWRSQPRHIAEGIIHHGRFERYFQTFRRWVLPLIHSRRSVMKLLSGASPHQQRRFYDERWNNWRWRALFRVFFGRTAMGKLGRDPEFFRYVQGRVADPLMVRVEHGLRHVPPADNPYLTYILNGNYGPALPRYLQAHRFDAIRAGLDRLTLAQGPIEHVGRQHVRQGFDAFNLSDIFEYIDPQTTRQIYSDLLALARPGARLAYWNTLVPRDCPAALRDRVTPLNDLAAALLARDQAFFYTAFVVDEFRPSMKEAFACADSTA